MPRSAKQRPAEGDGAPRFRSAFASYFLIVLMSFAVLSIVLNTMIANTHPSHEQMMLSSEINGQAHSTLRSKLEESVQHPPKAQPIQEDAGDSEGRRSLVGLDCARFGGPADTKEFVYWQDIPGDSKHISPFHRKRKGHTSKDQYLTFEPDHGGWNNIRMAMETILALAFAMGRTLVLPPEKELYLLKKKKKTRLGETQKTEFSFADFFHMDAIHDEHDGLDIITMDEFLLREGVTGNFKDPKTNKPVYPPGNRTDFNGNPDEIFKWLRKYSQSVVWKPESCLAVFPADASDAAVQDMKTIFNKMLSDNPQWEQYVNKPVPVDASALDRLKESRAGRSEMCLYDQNMQAAPFLHFPTDHSLSARLLVNPYQFLFFQEYREDLWMKRFIRDHVRYADEIQCVAARIVQGVRAKAREYNPANVDGVFDSIHVRRGDFQYKKTRISAAEIYTMVDRVLPKNTTLYIATDERDKSFFNDLKKYYQVIFLDDFDDELATINSNFYGMIEQLIAARGRYFFGTWFSTYTGYINRIRGYIHDKEKRPGYEKGIIDSWYHVLADRFDHMREYYPIKQSFYAREFPTAWRLIDTGLEDFHQEIAARKIVN